MLCSLHIENLAVIKSCDINFSPGFTALTGETGAGKSIILDGIGLLCGSRADKGLVRNGEEKAEVSGFFSNVDNAVRSLASEAGIAAEDGELLLSRSITADGRSACRINGRQVPLSVFKELAARLVNIHGQQDNWSLLDESRHLALLDKYASDGKLLEDYREAFGLYSGKKAELHRLVKQIEKDREEQDVLSYRLSDIGSVKLKPGEEQKLLEERKLLQNAERLEKQSGFAYRALKGGDKVNAVYLLDRSITALRSLSEVTEEFDKLAERLENAKYEIEDVADTAVSLIGTFDGDPTALLTALETRLDKIERLKKKYRRDADGLIELYEDTKKRLDQLESSEGDIECFEDELKGLKRICLDKASLLTDARRKAAAELAERICSELAFLDMPNVRFTVLVEPEDDIQLGVNGADAVRFMLAGSAGEEPKPLSKIASGGELSRVMLAIKSVFAEADGVDTVIFDEIDAGVSGKTARKIGIKLRNASENAQVFCVTHSAQIASLASSHLVVSKSLVDGRYSSSVREISGEERVGELSRILGGINVTDAQRKAAIDLLNADNDFE